MMYFAVAVEVPEQKMPMVAKHHRTMTDWVELFYLSSKDFPKVYPVFQQLSEFEHRL